MFDLLVVTISLVSLIFDALPGVKSLRVRKKEGEEEGGGGRERERKREGEQSRKRKKEIERVTRSEGAKHRNKVNRGREGEKDNKD